MNRILYSNIDDPRIFVYRDENIEYGITLNFAHRKAQAMMISWLVLSVFPVVLIWFFKAGIAAIAIFIAYAVCLVYFYLEVSKELGVSIVVISIKGASRDLKRHPGPKGPRARRKEG